jgi:EmrB/QacA subfamily drug resistance transporter
MEKNYNSKMAALLIATLASFVTPFIFGAINIAIPAIGSEFQSSAILLSWIPTSFLLACSMFAVPFGRLADIFGMKRIFKYGIIIFTIASFLCAVAPSAILLLVFLVLLGIGSAMIFVTSIAIVTHAFPANERGKAIGITITAVYASLSLGPVLGGIMTQFLGWRSLFFLMIPLGLIVIAITVWKLKDEWAICKGEKFDLPGSIIYSIALFLIIYGFSLLPKITGIILTCLGIVGIVIFVVVELRSKSPVFEIKLFKNATFAFSNLAALISYSATYAVIFLLSLYLQYIKGLSPASAGLILIAQPIVMVVLAPIAGRLSDKYNPRLIASVGMAITTIGLLFFVSLNANTNYGFIIAGLIILGAGFGLFSSPNTNAVMGSVEKRFFGVASASVQTMRVIGQTLSMGTVLIIFAIYIGNVQIMPAEYPALLTSVQIAFIVFTVLCFIGIFASLAKSGANIKQPQ